MGELPTILFEGRKYTFDYRLSELRTITKRGLASINLNTQENELLAFAIDKRDPKLIRANMMELKWKFPKLKEVI
jgi:hypothetical protein